MSRACRRISLLILLVSGASLRPVVADDPPAAAPSAGVENSAAESEQRLPVEPEAHPVAEDAHAAEAPQNVHGPRLGTLLPVASILPFCLLLLSIAVFPLFQPHWWEHNTNKGLIAAILALPTAIYLATFGDSGTHALLHAGEEYLSFVLLLGSLFVISGGVLVRGRLPCSPLMNTAILGIGTVIASFVGTTGASMLLIRPLLRANETRNRVAHIVVFFIFTVSNCGGLLTPLGDPPLFLGFLKGVPFEWTLRLTPHWLVVNGCLLAVFFVWDSLAFAGEKRRGEHEPVMTTEESGEPLGISGLHNFLFLGAIIAIIYCKGNAIGLGGKEWPPFLQEGLMLAAGLASFWLTAPQIRERNRFSFGPINEVAILFAGIFVTMIPALAILNVNGKQLGLTEDWHFFWASGMLSRWARRPSSRPFPADRSSWAPTRTSAMARISWSRPSRKKTTSACRASSATWRIRSEF